MEKLEKLNSSGVAVVPRLNSAQREQFIRDGYVQVSGLIPEAVVHRTRVRLLAAMEVDPDDPATWKGKPVPHEDRILSLTEACRTVAIEEVAEELAGPRILRGVCHSNYLEAMGVDPPITRGYIPILNYPVPGPREFRPPSGYHIDGGHLATLWPGTLCLVLVAYLTDTAEYGGATTVRPGSHRQVFEYWHATGHGGSTHPPDLAYADPIPLPGRAGDVTFMHYLTVHSGSPNYSDHIRVGLNTHVMPDPAKPFTPISGPPQPDWTPLDYTLRIG